MAFGKASKARLLFDLVEFGVPYKLTHLIASIFQGNLITTQDGVAVRDTLQQMTKVAQNGDLRPLLFSGFLSDLLSNIMGKGEPVRITILPYANDLTTYEASCFTIALQFTHRLPSTVGNKCLPVNQVGHDHSHEVPKRRTTSSKRHSSIVLLVSGIREAFSFYLRLTLLCFGIC